MLLYLRKYAIFYSVNAAMMLYVFNYNLPNR